MAQHTYYLANNSTEPLTLSWGFNWKNLKVSYLGELLGEIVTKKELVEGREFQLPDNRVVSVKLKGSMMPQLEVLLNNEPVNGSATDPEAVIAQIFKLSMILGGLNFMLGIFAYLQPTEFLTRLGMGLETVFTGLLIMALAYGIKKRSMAALIASIAFWVLDYAASIFFAMQDSGTTNPSAGFFMRMVIVYSLYRGIAALKKLKQQAQPEIQVA